MPLLAKHPYDVSKACAEMIAVNYRHTYGLPVSITRCANLYGGGDLNFDRRSDGAMLRDYLFVLDAVSAYLTLAQAMDDPALFGEAFNLGMDDPHSVLEVAQLVISLSDHPELEPIVENRELREIHDQYLCSDKARRLLGWRPQHTLEQGLKQTIAWYQAFLVTEGLLE